MKRIEDLTDAEREELAKAANETFIMIAKVFQDALQPIFDFWKDWIPAFLEQAEREGAFLSDPIT